METQVYDFLVMLVKALVDDSEAVSVDRKVDEMGVLYTVSVAQDDMGKIIGRSGNTAKSIRTLLRVAGQKFGERANMKISEPEGSTHGFTPEAAPAADVDAAIDELKGDF